MPGAGRLDVARIRLLLIGAAPLLFGIAARAEEPRAAEAWNDRNMRSNFAHFLERPGDRPAILGVDADGHIVHDAKPATHVPELTLHISPHEWQPGGPRGGSLPDRPAAFSSATGAMATRGSGGARAPSTSGGMRHAAP